MIAVAIVVLHPVEIAATRANVVDTRDPAVEISAASSPDISLLRRITALIDPANQVILERLDSEMIVDPGRMFSQQREIALKSVLVTQLHAADSLSRNDAWVLAPR